jgi:hypothetical protein
MKCIILNAVLFSFLISSYGQGFKIVAINDNLVRVDSVIFGYTDNATLGVDAALGEANIFNRPVQSYDMRVVQRDSTNFSCSSTLLYNSNGHIIDTVKHYFPTNFDSKVNYRSKRDTSFLNRLFEIKFLSSNIMQFYISSLVPNQFADFTKRNAFNRYLDSCLSKKPAVLLYIFDPLRPQDPILVVTNSPISNMVFLFDPGFLLDSREATINTKTRVYPNPASDVLIIDNIEVGKVKNLRLFDILGREVLTQKVEGSESVELNVSQLSRGTYLLTLYNDAAQTIFTKTVIK